MKTKANLSVKGLTLLTGRDPRLEAHC